MKIRNGFVSNSSSSSFVLKLNKKIETVRDVIDIFFEGDSEAKLVPEKYADDYGDHAKELTNEEGADALFKQMFNNEIDEEWLKANPESAMQIVKEYDREFDPSDGWHYYTVDDVMDDMNNPFREDTYKVRQMLGPMVALDTINRLKEKEPNSHIYMVEVGNENGFVESFLEDSSIYEKDGVEIIRFTNMH